MARSKILTLILAGGEGKRMDVLAQVRAKPALPFAGVYRLIDFPLSNCVHSGLSDVWIIEQFRPHSINQHLANGRPWDLDRTYGGLRVLQPHTGTRESGWHQGNADAIHRNRSIIDAFDPDVILVLSADHIYKLDFSAVIDAHLEREADVTMVTTRVPLEEAGRFGTAQVDDGGKVTAFAYKPDEPESEIVTTEVFVYNARKLLDTLDRFAAEGDRDDGEPALKDFGHQLLPALVEEGRAYHYPLAGYWRDVGVIESYWRAHMDLLAPEPPLNLDDDGWPILTYGVQRMPARIRDSARIPNSLVSPGCEVRGHVECSVLSPGCFVEEGAIVRNAILLHDTVVRSGARVENVIVDSGVEIGPGARIGEESRDRDTPAITVIGQGARIAAGASVAAGEHVPPSTNAAESAA